MAAVMSSSDGISEPRDLSAQRRKRRNTSLLVLAAGLLLFCAAAGSLYYVLRPVTLRIAVGPSGSEEKKLVEALARSFDIDRNAVRLSPITTDGAVESLGLLGAGKADLAVGRGDLDMPRDAETVAIVRKNFVVLWSPSGLPGKGSKRQPAPKIKTLDDLAGHRVRSEEHTPELQSQSNLVCRLLLEKKTGASAGLHLPGSDDPGARRGAPADRDPHADGQDRAPADPVSSDALRRARRTAPDRADEPQGTGAGWLHLRVPEPARPVQVGRRLRAHVAGEPGRLDLHERNDRRLRQHRLARQARAQQRQRRNVRRVVRRTHHRPGAAPPPPGPQSDQRAGRARGPVDERRHAPLRGAA